MRRNKGEITKRMGKSWNVKGRDKGRGDRTSAYMQAELGRG